MKKTRSGKRDPSSSSKKGCGVRRVAYFDGQLLGAADFTDEQSYFRNRLRRRNLLLHGAGIVTGLKVSLAPSTGPGGPGVVVDPGFAFDRRGEEIEVCRPVFLPLPHGRPSLFVQVAFAERAVGSLPAPGPPVPSGEGDSLPSRIEETFAVVLRATADPGAVAIARLAFRRGQWRVDRSFKPPRAS